MLFGGKLALAPLDKDNLRYALDIATGTGIWAIEFGEQHPEVQVLGTDLSAIQPTWVPSNVSFEVADAEDVPWLLPHQFDYVHARAVLSCFTTPLNVFKEAYNALKPGGFCEFQDPIMPFKYASPPPSDSAFVRWNELSMRAAAAGGRPWDNVQHYAAYMREVGFVDVTECWFRVNTGPWSDAEGKKGRFETELGKWQLQNWMQALDGMTMRNLARIGWKPEESRALAQQVRDELMQGHLKIYSDILVVYGRKPNSS